MPTWEDYIPKVRPPKHLVPALEEIRECLEYGADPWTCHVIQRLYGEEGAGGELLDFVKSCLKTPRYEHWFVTSIAEEKGADYDAFSKTLSAPGLETISAKQYRLLWLDWLINNHAEN